MLGGRHGTAIDPDSSFLAFGRDPAPHIPNLQKFNRWSFLASTRRLAVGFASVQDSKDLARPANPLKPDPPIAYPEPIRWRIVAMETRRVPELCGYESLDRATDPLPVSFGKSSEITSRRSNPIDSLRHSVIIRSRVLAQSAREGYPSRHSP